MGGRRSRYWCGPGIFRETKKAPVRGFIGQWSAPTFLNRKVKTKRGQEAKEEQGANDKQSARPPNGFVFSNRLFAERGRSLTKRQPAASGTPELSSPTHNPQPPVCQTINRSRVRSAKTKHAQETRYKVNNSNTPRNPRALTP